MNRRAAWMVLLLVLPLSSCAEPVGEPAPEPETDIDLDNPFTADYSASGKEDTGYVNPDGIEVEVTIEADVQAPSYRIYDAPAELGQFALTYLRNRNEFYLESLAEDATSDTRVEWLVNGNWLSAADARRQPVASLRHFRIRGVNAIMLHDVADGASDGQVFRATVPVDPYAAFTAGGAACTTPDDHLGFSASIYWYLWNPEGAGCTLATQEMTITVTRMLPARATTYPEYDRLIADRQITAVVLFGQIGDGAVTDSDPGVRNLNTMVRSLTGGGYREVRPAPLGRRFQKRVAGIDIIIDLYSPYIFSGLGDSGHFANFQKALSEHEIVAYDGHSMLGASDFWSRPTYNTNYQIFLYGGCLGYEYYVRPILAGKRGFANVDMVSSVVEVSADANYFFSPFMGKLMWALEHNYAASWTDYLRVIRDRVGDSTFGASGVANNCFSPTGSLCGTPTPTPTATPTRVSSTTALPIPDNNATGVRGTITVPAGTRAGVVSLELNVSHTYVSDLKIAVLHNGQTLTVWDHTGGANVDIRQTFALDAFRNVDPVGQWTLVVADTAAIDSGRVNSWTLVVTP